MDVIDFEGLAAGEILTSVFAAGGTGPVLVSGHSSAFGGGVNAAVVFDSAQPTGGDFDLGTPNQTCAVPGPGVGAGGQVGSPFENCQPLGKVLIVAENLVDVAPADGLVDDPDDADLVGSTLAFDFSALGTVTVCGITVIDVEGKEPAAELIVTFADTTELSFGLDQTGDNGVANVDIPCGAISGVVAARVVINGSGAVDNLVFEVEQTVCNPCVDVVVKCLDAAPGQPIRVNGRVRNCGDVDLTNVAIVHDNGTADPSDDVLVQLIPLLVPGEQQNFSTTYQPSVPPGTPSTVVVTATGTPPASCGLPDVTSSSQATCTQAAAVCNPCVDVVVKCLDAAAGQPIRVNGRVKNCGDVDLTNVAIVHDNGTPADPSDDVLVQLIALLLPGEQQNFSTTCQPSVPPGTPSTVLVTATGTPPPSCGLPDVSSSSQATCTQAALVCNPCIDVVVKCLDATPGRPIHFNGRVKNCGDVDLTNVAIVHDNGTADPSDDALVQLVPLLVTGDHANFSGSYMPSVPPGTPSTVVVTATGTPPAGCLLPDVTQSSQATCTQAALACSPCVDVVVKCLDAASGQPIQFNGRVRNCGDVDLTNVAIVHDNGTPADPSDDTLVQLVPLLVPDDHATFSGSYMPSVPPGTPSTVTVTSTGSPPAGCALPDATSSSQATCVQAP